MCVCVCVCVCDSERVINCVLQLKDHEDATVRTISTWLASQVTTDTSDKLATRERGKEKL